MKKKILFVINSLDVGGAEKSLTTLLSAFNYDKYDVDLLLFRASGVFLELLPKQVNVLPELGFLHDSDIISQLKYPTYLLAHIRASIGLRLNSKSARLHSAQCYWKYAGRAFNPLPKHYDAAIAWGQGNPTHYVAEKVNAIKKFAWVNADYASVGYNRDFDFPYYEKYNKIIGVSDMLSNALKTVFPEFADKIETVFDINNADLIEQMSLEPVELKRENNSWRLVTTGRLVEQKGYDIALEAARILKERKICFDWYVIGDGPERTKLENEIEKHNMSEYFHLMGAKSNPYPYMKSADIYVQTSKSEGFCITLAEARMLNVPCVTTEFDVVYNQMIPNENGIVVKIDPTAVADGIELLMNDKELYQHIRSYQMQEKKGNREELDKFYDLIEEVQDKK